MSSSDTAISSAVAGLNLPRLDDPTATVDLDIRGAAYLTDTKRRAAIERFEYDCPPAYRESEWDHPGLQPYQKQIQHVLAWRPGPKGLLLPGPTGRGKTRALFGLYRRLAYDGTPDIRYWHANDWFARLGEEVRYGRDDAAGWVEATASHAILILDDLGQEAVLSGRSDWASAHFFGLLDKRLARGLPIICTTNLGAEGLAAKFGPGSTIRGDPLVRRLLDLCEVVKF